MPTIRATAKRASLCRPRQKASRKAPVAAAAQPIGSRSCSTAKARSWTIDPDGVLIALRRSSSSRSKAGTRKERKATTRMPAAQAAATRQSPPPRPLDQPQPPSRAPSITNVERAPGRKRQLVLLGIAMVAFYVPLVILEQKLKDTGGPGIVDFEFVGSAERAAEMLAEWGEDGRDYARWSLWIDFGFMAGLRRLPRRRCARHPRLRPRAGAGPARRRRNRRAVPRDRGGALRRGGEHRPAADRRRPRRRRRPTAGDRLRERQVRAADPGARLRRLGTGLSIPASPQVADGRRLTLRT